MSGAPWEEVFARPLMWMLVVAFLVGFVLGAIVL